jgi:hypothetical protein
LDRNAIWQAILDELHATLPAVTFEQNIKNARLLSIEADAVCIGVPTLQVKKYCEMRLTSPIARFLKDYDSSEAIPTTVRFEVIRNEDYQDTNSLTATTQNEINEIPSELKITPSYEGIYEKTVTPTRVVVLPGYFLEHLPYLGPQAGWVYTACFQLSFFNNHPEGAIPIRAKDAVRWSGLSKNTFWKQIGDNPYLKHFVNLERENVPAGTQAHYRDEQGRKYRHVTVNQEVKLKREANHYFVQHTMPLTPEDASYLREWLLAHDFEKKPIETLRVALQTTVPILLGYSDIRKKERAGTIADENDMPVFLVHLIHDLLEEEMLENLGALLQPLIDSLQNQILLHFGHVFIPWYFIDHWVGLLGAQKAWAVILARKRCYQNTETGEVRSVFSYAHGFPELAYYLRVKNPQSISLWFKESKTRAGKPEWINLYLALMDSVKRKDQSVSRKFETVMNELIAPVDLYKVLYSAQLKSMLISLKQKGTKETSHSLIVVGEQKLHFVPVTALQKKLLSVLFQENPELHLFNDAEDMYEIQIQTSSVELLLPDSTQQKRSNIESLGYDDYVMHEAINIGINEKGTFTENGDNELRSFLEKTLIESGIFELDGVIELTTFLNAAVTELKTIGLDGGIEFETITKQGDNESNTKQLGGVDECGTIFKYLIKYVSGEIKSVAVVNSDSLNHSTVPLDGEGGEKIGREIEFDFFGILNRCNVSFMKQQELKDARVSVQALISMLLFIASPRGERLGMGYVITRLLENPKGLTDQYGELASLPAEGLIQHIHNALQMNVLGDYEWRIVMGGAQDAKLDELLYRLIGEKIE